MKYIFHLDYTVDDELIDVSLLPSFGAFFTVDKKSAGVRVGWLIWEFTFCVNKRS